MKILKVSTETHKEPKYHNKGFIRASYASSLASVPVGMVSKKILKTMKNSSIITGNDSIELKNAAEEGLKRTGLYDKGVRAYTIHENPIIQTLKSDMRKLFSNFNDEKAFETFSDKCQSILEYKPEDKDALDALKTEILSKKSIKRLMRNPLFSEMQDGIADTASKASALIYKEGSNAAFLPKANKIITPDKSLQTSIFHEMGHAMNANGGVLLKSLQKIRPFAMAIPGIILTDALLNKRKTTDKKPDNNSFKNRIQNVRDGIKKHAGILSAAALLPVVVEEGIATIRGEGVAKSLVKEGLLSSTTFKTIRKTNLCGFATYVISMIATGLATKLAINIKDRIQANYEQKKLEKFQRKQALKA